MHWLVHSWWKLIYQLSSTINFLPLPVAVSLAWNWACFFLAITQTAKKFTFLLFWLKIYQGAHVSVEGFHKSPTKTCCLLVALQGYGLCDHTNPSKCACQFNTVRTCAYWESTQVCHLCYMCEHVIDAVRGPCFASRGQQLSQDTPWGQHLA